jgi:hypothetical protein
MNDFVKLVDLLNDMGVDFDTGNRAAMEDFFGDCPDVPPEVTMVMSIGDAVFLLFTGTGDYVGQKCVDEDFKPKTS